MVSALNEALRVLSGNPRCLASMSCQPVPLQDAVRVDAVTDKILRKLIVHRIGRPFRVFLSEEEVALANLLCTGDVGLAKNERGRCESA